MKNHFSETLNQRLKGQNLSEVSRQLDIPATLLFEWTKAKRLPSFKSLSHIQKLAHYLGLTLEELLIGEESVTTLTSVQFEDNKKKYLIKIQRLK